MSRSHALVAVLGLATWMLGSCSPALPPIRFAPAGTDRAASAASSPERRRATCADPESLRADPGAGRSNLSAACLGPDARRPVPGRSVLPARSRRRRAHPRLRRSRSPSALTHRRDAAEHLGALWKGKVFFRSQGVLRNRIEDLLILRPIVTDADTVPKLTFDGQTSWLLFPARLSCGQSRLDPSRRSILIDYAQTADIEGYRPVPDRLAGPDGLTIFDEVRVVRPGLYLGRSYFRDRFALNFTLLDPAVGADAPLPAAIGENCDGRGRRLR